MPSLTVKAIAEMLRLPAYNQTRILHEQKYPKQQPQIFRTPYYQPAIAAFREYYRTDNDPSVLMRARNAAQSISLESRRTQILRAIDSFESSSQAKRKLKPTKNERLSAKIGDVEIRLALDMRASEGADQRALYYNCRHVAIDEDVARLMCEIAHWVLDTNGISMPMRNFEVVDLAIKKVLRFEKRRAATVRLMRENARIISTLWAAI